MATVVDLVQPRDTFGGLRDGYRRTQLGQPSGTVGQLPKNRGESNVPGQDIKAPKILSSAARHNRGTNATLPYARVTPADELADIGRVGPGDVLFIQRHTISMTSAVRENHKQAAQVTRSVSTPHANVQRVCGLDAMNRMLAPNNYRAERTILVNATHPADDWRRLGLCALACALAPTLPHAVDPKCSQCQRLDARRRRAEQRLAWCAPSDPTVRV